MSECKDCAAVNELAVSLYDQIDRQQSVENTVAAITSVLIAAIASCGDSDGMLTHASDRIKKTSGALQELEIWNQSLLPRLSHTEVVHTIACCGKHVSASPAALSRLVESDHD